MKICHGVTDSSFAYFHYFLSAAYSQKHLIAMDSIRNFEEAKKLKFDEEKYKTATSIDQVRIDVFFFFLNGSIIMFFLLFVSLVGHRTSHRKMF